jgi:hypothetical protein
MTNSTSTNSTLMDWEPRTAGTKAGGITNRFEAQVYGSDADGMFDHAAAFERYRLRVIAAWPQDELKRATVSAIQDTIRSLQSW